MREHRFELLKEFVAKIATVVDIGTKQNLFSVISYSEKAHLRFPLRKFIHRRTLLRGIRAIPYTGGNTNTAAALTLLQDHSLLGLRDGYRHVVVVVTDGLSRKPVNTAIIAADLHATNVYDIFALGVLNANLQELQAIASQDEYVFISNNFAAATLEEYAKQLLSMLCSSKSLH